ncbi:hypothetical protein BJY00DRAFT_297144 [Aspergillus carlsbadensis]|nr:hypothetical protein BJY00DRAFT_297144 [Aspergillus carlsbadensis]
MLGQHHRRRTDKRAFSFLALLDTISSNPRIDSRSPIMPNPLTPQQLGINFPQAYPYAYLPQPTASTTPDWPPISGLRLSAYKPVNAYAYRHFHFLGTEP